MSKQSSIYKKILTSFLIILFVVSTFGISPNTASAQSEDLLNNVARGFVDYSVCGGGSLSDKLKSGLEGAGITAAIGIGKELIGDFATGGFGEFIGSVAPLANLIPGAGPIIGGILGGIFGGGDKGPKPVLVPELQEKENCLDAMSRMTAVDMLNQYAAHTLNWVQREFEESNPGFVFDVYERLATISDSETYRFLTSDVFVDSTCGLLEGDIGDVYEAIYTDQQLGQPRDLGSGWSLNIPALPPDRTSGSKDCGIRNIIRSVEDAEDFVQGDITKGGWEGWFAYTLNPKNNPREARQFLSLENQRRIQEAQESDAQEVSYGGGFLAMKSCPAGSTQKGPNICIDGEGNSYTPTVITPASLVSRMVFEAASSDPKQAEFVDEFNETVADFGNWMWRSITDTGLAAARETRSNAPASGLIGLIRADIEHLEKVLPLIDMITNSGGLTVPSPDGYSMDDLMELTAEYAEGSLVPIGSCNDDVNAITNPDGDSNYSGDFGSGFCDQSSAIDFSVFGRGIDVPKIHEFTTACINAGSNVSNLTSARDSVWANTPPTTSGSGQSLSVIKSRLDVAYEDLRTLRDEITALTAGGEGFSASDKQAFTDRFQTISAGEDGWRNQLKPNEWEFIRLKSIDVLKYIQHLSLLQKELNNTTGACKLLSPKITIDVASPINNTNTATYPQEKLSKIEWSYEGINTTRCSASFTPPLTPNEGDGELADHTAVVINRNSGNAQTGTAPDRAVAFTNLYLLLYHSASQGFSMTITCTNPDSYNLPDTVKSVNINSAGSRGSIHECNDGIDNDKDGFFDEEDSDCRDSSPQTERPSADTDGDGITDDIDNCPNIGNALQEDSDGDGVGDVCEGGTTNSAPSLSLIPDKQGGVSEITVTEGDKPADNFDTNVFSMPFVFASDAEDGDDLSSQVQTVITGYPGGVSIDINNFWENVGLSLDYYLLLHTITDSSNVTTNKIRRVNIEASSDDGPGA